MNASDIKDYLSKCFIWMSDDLYLRMIFFLKNKKHLNLKNPVTFCDKLNWMKINYRNPKLSDYADKIKVCDIVKEKLGKDICFPILGVYERYEDIDFSKLPDKFVIKNNHDSGSVKVVRDKNKINHQEFKKHFNIKLKRNPYFSQREFPYKNIKSKILIETYMTPDDQTDIEDYKFFCFNGKPVVVAVVTARMSDYYVDFYDMDFNHTEIEDAHHMSNILVDKPENFEEMKETASKLSEGLPFVRVDLYSIKGKIYFGEYTFFHNGGVNPLKPDKYETKFGNMIDINNIF